MKKIVITTLGIVLTTTSAMALIDHYVTIPAGEYHCPEQNKKTCIINKYKTGDMVYGSDCLEDQYSSVSKYAPMIKRGECQILPDPGKYYLCEFADAKCNVNIFSSRTAISCTNQKKAVNYQVDRSYATHKILQAAQTGQCQDRYLAETTSTEETTATTATTAKNPEIQKPQSPVKTEQKPKTNAKPEVKQTPVDVQPKSIAQFLQPSVPATQPLSHILPEISTNSVESKILEQMHEQYKASIRQELEKEIPLYTEPDIIPVEETSTIYIQKTDELDNNIKMILEKYENLEWEQTD